MGPGRIPAAGTSAASPLGLGWASGLLLFSPEPGVFLRRPENPLGQTKVSPMTSLFI